MDPYQVALDPPFRNGVWRVIRVEDQMIESVSGLPVILRSVPSPATYATFAEANAEADRLNAAAAGAVQGEG